jgi:HEAT repeat protein
MSDDLTTDDYIWLLKNSVDPDERLYSAFKLGRLRDAIVVQPLIDAHSDTEANVRVRVAEALGTRDESEVIPPLISLLQDTEARVRRQAAMSLGHLGDSRAVEPLAIALKDEEADVRAQAAESLGKILSNDSAPPLVDAFLHDEDANVRYFAKQSLGHVGIAAVDAILAVVDATDDPALLVEICEILGSLADRRAKPTLERLQSHEDEGVAEMAKWALNTII